MNPSPDRLRELCAGMALDALDSDERDELARLLEAGGEAAWKLLRDLETAALHLPVAPVPADLLPASALDLEKRILAAARGEPRSRRRAHSVSLVLATLVLALGLLLLRERRQAAELVGELDQHRQIEELLHAPALEVVTLGALEAAPASRGRILWDSERDVALLRVEGLPLAPPGHAYQIWVFAGDAPPVTPGALPDVSENSDAWIRILDFAQVPKDTMTGILITLEAGDGAEQPGDRRCLGARVSF